MIYHIFLETLVTPNNLFRKHVQSAKGSWINLGYTRKSPSTNDNTERRKELLNLMAERLRKNCFCGRIYSSESFKSTMPILQRDSGVENRISDDFKGNTQGK